MILPFTNRKIHTVFIYTCFLLFVVLAIIPVSGCRRRLTTSVNTSNSHPTSPVRRLSTTELVGEFGLATGIVEISESYFPDGADSWTGEFLFRPDPPWLMHMTLYPRDRLRDPSKRIELLASYNEITIKHYSTRVKSNTDMPFRPLSLSKSLSTVIQTLDLTSIDSDKYVDLIWHNPRPYTSDLPFSELRLRIDRVRKAPSELFWSDPIHKWTITFKTWNRMKSGEFVEFNLSKNDEDGWTIMGKQSGRE